MEYSNEHLYGATIRYNNGKYSKVFNSKKELESYIMGLEDSNRINNENIFIIEDKFILEYVGDHKFFDGYRIIFSDNKSYIFSDYSVYDVNACIYRDYKLVAPELDLELYYDAIIALECKNKYVKKILIDKFD